MWCLTAIVAVIGVLIAIVSFFKNRRFFWCFKNEKDLNLKEDGLEDLDEDDLEVLDLNNNRKEKKNENCNEAEVNEAENENKLNELSVDKYIIE